MNLLFVFVQIIIGHDLLGVGLLLVAVVGQLEGLGVGVLLVLFLGDLVAADGAVHLGVDGRAGVV